MTIIPKLSQPLAKSIRTGEGLLVYATNVALGVAAILPHGLSWTHSALYLTILNGVHVLSRTLLKVAALPLGLGAPIAPPAAITSTVDAVLAQIADVELAAKVLQAKPGVPAEQVSAGLAPEPITTSPPKT